MKKHLAVLILISLFMLVVAPGSAQSQEKPIIVKLGDILPPDHPNIKAYNFFADRVKERTKGRVQVQVFHSAQLGQSKDLYMGLQTGAVEMAKISLAFVGEWMPEVFVFDLPYLFADHNSVWKVFKSPMGKRFFTDIFPKQSLVGLWWVDEGVRSIYANKPVRKPEDLKGMKIRVQPSEVQIQAMNLMGGIATPMAYGEVYMGIQQKVVDGAENNPVALLSSRHFEVAKTFSLTEQFWLICTVFASKKWWDTLPPDLQTQISLAAEEAEKYHYDTYVAEEKQAISILTEKGVQVITDVDKAAFEKRVQPVYDSFTKKYGKDVLEQVRAVVKSR